MKLLTFSMGMIQNEIENIKSRLDTVLAAQVRYSQDYHIEEGWGNVIHTYMSKSKLTKEMADAFVDSIIILCIAWICPRKFH